MPSRPTATRIGAPGQYPSHDSLCDSSIRTETYFLSRTKGAAIPRKLVLAVVALVICLAVVEVVCHRTPHTRWQVVQDFELIDGIPVYGMAAGQGEGVRNDACLTEDGADVLLLGDSILHGVLLEDRETLGPRLSQALKHADGSRACVVNASIPGFTLANEWAVLKRDWGRYTPKVVVLQIWHNTPFEYRVIGDKLYNFGPLLLDDGVPNPLRALGAVNRALFERSALWRHIVERTASARVPGRASERFWGVLPTLDLLHQWLADRDAQLVLAYATPLSEPWDMRARRDRDDFQVVRGWAEEKQVPSLWFSDILSSQPVEAVRLDTCCHLNADGMAMVSDAMEIILQPMLDDLLGGPTPEEP